MNAELFAGFEKELSELKERVANQRAKLELLEDAEGCAIQRRRIAALETLLAEVTAARNKIMFAEAHAEATVKQFAIWRERVCAVRAAKLAVDEFAWPIEKCQAEIDNGENRLQIAQAALAAHQAHPVHEPDYASQTVIRKWQKRCTELQAAVNERSAELRALKDNIAGLRREWMRA